MVTTCAAVLLHDLDVLELLTVLLDF